MAKGVLGVSGIQPPTLNPSSLSTYTVCSLAWTGLWLQGASKTQGVQRLKELSVENGKERPNTHCTYPSNCNLYLISSVGVSLNQKNPYSECLHTTLKSKAPHSSLQRFILCAEGESWEFSHARQILSCSLQSLSLLRLEWVAEFTCILVLSCVKGSVRKHLRENNSLDSVVKPHPGPVHANAHRDASSLQLHPVGIRPSLDGKSQQPYCSQSDG